MWLYHNRPNWFNVEITIKIKALAYINRGCEGFVSSRDGFWWLLMSPAKAVDLPRKFKFRSPIAAIEPMRPYLSDRNRSVNRTQ